MGKEGSRVKIEVTRVNYGRDSLPFIQGKLLADEEGEMVGYDSGIEVKSEAGTPIPPVTEKRKREEEEEEKGDSCEKKLRLENVDQKLDETLKKSKKGKHSDVIKEENIPKPEIKQEPEVVEPVRKKKKKKDKEREKINDVPELEVKTEIEPSDFIKKKKKKKDKVRENEEAMPSQMVIEQEPD